MASVTRTEMKPHDVVYATRCDECGKTAEGSDPDGWLHFSSHHSEWGNDSVESWDYWDVCSFACYIAKVRAIVDDWGDHLPSLEIDDKDIEFVRGMLAALSVRAGEGA